MFFWSPRCRREYYSIAYTNDLQIWFVNITFNKYGGFQKFPLHQNSCVSFLLLISSHLSTTNDIP